MRTRVALRGLLLSVALAAGPGLAEPPQPPAAASVPPHADPFIEELVERLGLDDATRAEIRRIAENSRAQEDGLRRRLKLAHDRMHALLEQENPDPEAVLRQADRIGDFEVAERKVRLRAMLKIRGLLTPAQRRELMRIRHEARPRRTGSPGACHPDVARFCSDAAPGVEVLACLREHLPDLSERCRALFEAADFTPKAAVAGSPNP